MADGTGIEWTEATWNPVVGCTHVSAGCDNCYAAREVSGRLRHHAVYAGLASGGRFTGEVRTLPVRLDQPLRWRRPRRIFVNSMADLFHDGVPDEFIAQVFGVMAAAGQHQFQVLTKRHARARSLLSSEAFVEQVYLSNSLDTATILNGGWPLPNVWLGVSVEDQRWADIRIPALLETPAAVRWISAEPLLGPIDLQLVHHFDPGRCGCDPTWGVHEPACGREPGKHWGLDWVVAGGESGPNARPMHPDWARSLRDQCTGAGVPFLFKQWGEWTPNRPADWRAYRIDRMRTWLPDGTNYRPTEPDMLFDPAMATTYRAGKRAAGRELDGQVWDQYPQQVGMPA